MSMDNVFQIPGYKEIKDGNTTLWEKAAQQTKTGQSVTFRNTRKSPAFSPLVHAKVHGNSILWGRYKPCDGITNAASTSIDTGVYTVDNMELFVRFKAITGSFYLLQARETSGSTIYGISGGHSGNTINAYGITSGISRTAGHIYTVKMTMVNRAVTLYVKDETAGTEDTKTGTAAASTYPFPSPTTIKLFGDASMLSSGATVYRAYIKTNGKMAWDMYPCVDSANSNTPVAYDDVTHAASTVMSGSITAGSIIQPVEYVQGDGASYAITDIKFEKTDRVEIYDYNPTSSAQGTILGCSLSGSECFEFFPSASKIWVSTYNTQILLDANLNANNNIVYDNCKIYVNGQLVHTYSTSEVMSINKKLALLATNKLTSVSYMGKCFTVGRIRIVGKGDFIPVRIGTIVEYFDLLNWRFATRTGTFTAGPDVTIKVEGVGDKTANLFDKNNRTRIFGYFASTGTTWTYNTSAYSNKIPCKPNTTYTARYNGNSTQAVLGFGSCSTDEEPSASTGNVTVTQGIRQNSPTINTPITITTGPDDKWLIVAYNVAEPQHTDMADNLQIEEGSTATPHTPYGYKISVTLDNQTYNAYLNDMLYDDDEYDFQTSVTPISLTAKTSHTFTCTNTVKGNVSVTYLGKD